MNLGDNSTLQITVKKLDGHNFLDWSQAAKLYLNSKGKMECILRTIKEPDSSNPKFD